MDGYVKMNGHKKADDPRRTKVKMDGLLSSKTVHYKFDSFIWKVEMLNLFDLYDL